MKLIEGSKNFKLNLKNIPLGKNCDADEKVHSFIEDEDGLRVFELEVDFFDKNGQGYFVRETLYSHTIDDGEVVCDNSKDIREIKKFNIYDYAANNSIFELENDKFEKKWKNLWNKLETDLMEYLEKRFKELKELEKKGELENYLKENGYLNPKESQTQEQEQQNQVKRFKRK